MKIVILGAGNVGYTLAETLSEIGHDIVLIESQKAYGMQIQNELDIQVVIGNGSKPAVLMEAGVGQDPPVDVLIACANQDEVNIMACWQAKHLGVKHVISRAMSEEYASNRQWAEMLGIDEIISPERSLARRIEEILTIRSAVHTTEFFAGAVGSYAFRISDSSKVCGMRLGDITREFPEFQAVIVYVERGDDGFIPSGDWVAKEGDLCYLITFREHSSKIEKFFVHGRTKRLKRVIIIGGGKIGTALIEQLLVSRPGTEIKLIEADEELCHSLAERFPEIITLAGDGADEKLLLHEGIDKADGCVCATGLDERNLILATLTKNLGVHKSIAVVKNRTYHKVGKSLPVDASVNPNETLISEILRYVQYPDSAQSLSHIGRIDSEILEVTISDESPVIGKQIAELNLPKGVVFAMIKRSGKVILPNGATVISAGDVILIFSKHSEIAKLSKVMGLSS